MYISGKYKRAYTFAERRDSVSEIVIAVCVITFCTV